MDTVRSPGVNALEPQPGGPAPERPSHRLDPPRGATRMGLLAAVGGAVLMAAWAQMAPLSGAVVAQGLIKADGERKTVSHQEGGIVKRVLVKDGDQVQAGQLLLTLDDITVGSALEGVRVQIDTEQARIARLSAERDLVPAFDPLPWVRASADLAQKRRRTDLAQKEQALFSVRRQALNAQIKLIGQQIGDSSREAGALEALVKTTQTGFELSSQELGINEKLKDDGFISDTRLLQLKRDASDYRAKYETQQQELAKAGQRRTELSLSIARLQADYAKQASDELKDATSRLFKLLEDAHPLEDAMRREDIVAPVAGEVVELKVHTLGAPIGPREPLLDIEPKNAVLIAEAHIKPDNIRDVQLGGKADIRLTAYQQRSTPTLEGRVTYIGADRQTERMTDQPYYTVRMSVSAAALKTATRLAGRRIELSPGMQVEAFIKTEDRSAFDYLWGPVEQSLSRGMRER